MNKKLNEEFNILSNDVIEQCSDLQNALELINKENIITNIEPIEAKKFIVKKADTINDVTKASLEEKTDVELDEIANQADQAFYDLMDIAINTSGKGCGDIASAANSFLNLKLNAKMAKIDSKMKKLNYELNKQKVEASLKKYDTPTIENEDDGIVILENN